MSSSIQAAAATVARAASAAAAAATASTAAARAAGVAAASRPKKAAVKPQATVIDALVTAAGPAVGRALRDGLTAALRRRGSVAGYATRTSSTAKGPLAFLSDPKLSIEQKLMRFLAYQNDEWEKQMNAKMKKLEGGQGSSSGGLLGGIAGAIGGALKLSGASAILDKVGGPVLGAAASALGFPAAAPILAKYGGKILGAAAGAASSLADQASPAVKDSDKQLAMMEIQQLMQKQKEMFSLVSGALRSIHETRSAVIGNIR